MRGSLDLRRLRYFLKIADCGAISAAARSLNLAQPALSYHLAELERMTGHSLFHRSRDGVVLTGAGRFLRGHAMEIIARVDAAERGLEALAGKAPLLAGRMRIAIISSLAAELTPFLVEGTTASAPDVTLHIIEAGTRDIMRKLKQAEVDMAIYLTSGYGAQEKPIAHEPLYYVAPVNRGQGDIAFMALLREPLVMPASGNPLRDHLEEAAHKLGAVPDVVLEVDGERSRLRAVSRGIGGSILGAHTVRAADLERGLVVREIVSPQLVRPIFLGARRDLDPALESKMRSILAQALSRIGLATVDADN